MVAAKMSHVIAFALLTPVCLGAEECNATSKGSVLLQSSKMMTKAKTGNGTVDNELRPVDESYSDNREPLAVIDDMQSNDDLLKQQRHKGASAAVCARPTHWCASWASYTEVDCDGDGIRDPYCADPWYSGFISSASGCHDTYPHGGCQATYIPGTPGASWTAEEMLIVRAKIQRMFNEGQTLVWEAANSYFGHGAWFKASWYSGLAPATVLRLGFHDCLKYKDGTGGCDGCLNWDGMEYRHTGAQGSINSTDRPDGGNNGLTTVAHVLEAIYKYRNFPQGTPLLAISLEASGKSRADLWAFAVTEAVRHSMELNNLACDRPEETHQRGLGCSPRLGEGDCKFEVPVLSFQTGRKDCISTSSPGFKTNKAESHPNPAWNGKMVADFMKRDFNFSGQETVAIMGAHTIGSFNPAISLFRYTWKTFSGKLFNNGYYRNLAMKPDWYYGAYPQIRGRPCRDTGLGNSTGERPLARFKTFSWGVTNVGGPVQWVQEKFVCPDCRVMDLTWARGHYDRCCKPTMSAEFEANLNQTVAEGKAVEYRLSAFGTYECPTKFEAIPDKATCVQAANSVQRIFDDHFSHHNMTDHPYGCLYDRHARISFNPNGNKQQSNNNYGAVCRADASPYAHGAWSTYACPAESSAILDEAACRLAAHRLAMGFNDYFQTPWSNAWGKQCPRGCIKSLSGQVLFNPHGQNKTVWNLAPLCQKLATPKPSTAVCKTTTGHQCVFPFKYKGIDYSGCLTQGHNESWCYTEVDNTGQGVPGRWGTCKPSCRLDYKELSYRGCPESCLGWIFIPGADECMLSSDMGLYLDFNVSDGIPSGCKGFENYNMDSWGRSPWSFPRHTVAQCQLNTLSVPAGTASLSQVVELYADNQTQFVNDFAQVLLKMLSNGYSNLTSAPDAGMTGFSCPHQEPSNATRIYRCERQ